MKKLTTISLFFLIGMSIQAQDHFFSQFHLSPLNLNPALTGTSGGDQIVINYRDQERNIIDDGAFQTLSLSYDRPFYLKNGDVIGVGAKFVNAEAGSSSFTNRGGSLLSSYQKRIFKESKKEQFLIAGLEGGYFRRSLEIDTTNIITPDGRDGLKEFINTEDYYYPDFAFGLSYRLKFDERRAFNIGFLADHVFEPRVASLLNSTSTESRTFIYFAMMDFKIHEKLILSPRFSYWTRAGADLLIASTSLNFLIGKHSLEATFGGRLGVNDTNIRAYFFAPTFFINNKIGISGTFEMNQGDLNNKGIESLEGTLIYRFGRKKEEQITE